MAISVTALGTAYLASGSANFLGLGNQTLSTGDHILIASCGQSQSTLAKCSAGGVSNAEIGFQRLHTLAHSGGIYTDLWHGIVVTGGSAINPTVYYPSSDAHAIGVYKATGIGTVYEHRVTPSQLSTNVELYSGSTTRYGWRFQAMASTLTSVSVRLSKSGNPTGNVSIVVRTWRQGSVVGTLGTVDASTLSTDGSGGGWKTITGSVSIPDYANVYISVEYSSGDYGNFVRVWSANCDYYTTHILGLTYTGTTYEEFDWRCPDHVCSTTLVIGSLLDKYTGATGTSTTPSSGATATLTEANELVIGYLGAEDRSRDLGTWTTGSGYVSGNEQSVGTTISVATAAEIVTATTAQTAAQTGGDSVDWAMGVVTLRGTGIYGTLSKTLDGISKTIEGTVSNTTHLGSLTKTLDNVTGNLVGRHQLFGALTKTLGDVGITATNSKLLTKVGAFNIDTTKTSGQTQSITGVGFQPELIIFFSTGTTGTDDTVESGTLRTSIGMACDAQQFAVGGYSEDGASSSTCYMWIFTDAFPATPACVACLNAREINGTLGLYSMDSDGFTLVVANTQLSGGNKITVPMRIGYLAIGGGAFGSVKIGQAFTPTSTGNHSVTSMGFKPDVLFIVGAAVETWRYATRIDFSIGMGSASDNQGVLSFASYEGSSVSNTLGYAYSGEILNTIGSGGYLARDALVSLDSDGFTLNHLEGTSAVRYFYVGLSGMELAVGQLNTRTDSNNIEETVGFKPQALFLASSNRPECTQDTPTDHLSISMGALSGSTRIAAAGWDEDNLDTQETTRANYNSALYANVKDDAVVGLMDYVSLDTSGFTLVMDDPDPTANMVLYFAVAALETSGALSKTLDNASLSATGVVGSFEPIEGLLTKTLDDFGLLGIGRHAIEGVLSKALDNATLVADGSARQGRYFGPAVQ